MTNAPATTAPATDASARWEDNAEFWVRIIREHRDRYRTELTDQAVFAAAGSCQGLDVLDVGCGEGYMTREIARRGARQATGIDKSPALIAAARSGSAGQQGIRFGEADAAALPPSPTTCSMTCPTSPARSASWPACCGLGAAWSR